MRKRVSSVVAILLVLVPGLLAAGPPAQAEDLWVFYVREESAPPGWVHIQYVIHSTWCNNSGDCGTDWTPAGQRAIFERVPDRVNLAHGYGDDAPPYPPVGRWNRLRCADGQWAAGTWYHNSTWEGGWTLANRYISYNDGDCGGAPPCQVEIWREVWTSMSSDYSNFGPDDRNCNDPGSGGGGGGGGNETPGVPTQPPPPEPTGRPTRPPATERPIVPLPDSWDEDHTTPPTISLGYHPPFPVIVGQDPAGMGVTLCFTVTTWPVEHIHHWYTCQHPPGQPNRCYEGTIVEHTEVTRSPDPPAVGETSGFMKLTEESKDWIEAVLGPKFGVRVQHPDWAIPPAPAWPWEVVGPLENLTYRAYGCGQFAVEDPGWYQVDLMVVTDYGVAGHFPIPLPRVGVTAFGVTLIK